MPLTVIASVTLSATIACHTETALLESYLNQTPHLEQCVVVPADAEIKVYPVRLVQKLPYSLFVMEVIDKNDIPYFVLSDYDMTKPKPVRFKA